MKIAINYSETVYYRDELELSNEDIEAILNELNIALDQRKAITDNPEEILRVAKLSTYFWDHLSEGLSFNIVDSDNFQYDYMNPIVGEGE